MTALIITLLFLIALVGAVWAGGEWLVERARDRRRAQEARDLDRAQAQTRAAAERLASDLGANAHEARKALIRESYLASGRFPNHE